VFAPVSPYGQGSGGFQISWGSFAQPVSDMSANIYGGGSSGGFSFGFGSTFGGIGTYYGFGSGFAGATGFRRQPGQWGQFGWGRPSSGGNPIARGMHASAGLADSVFGPATTPQGINAIFNQREQAYSNYLGAQRAKRASQQNNQSGEGKAAPNNLADRANDYFDGIVGDKKKPGKIYNSQGNKQIQEWEKEDAESNSDAKGREQALTGLATQINDWMNGDNSSTKRGEFLAQIDAWNQEGTTIDTEQKLLAIVAPGVDKKKDIPSAVYQRLNSELGANRQLSGEGVTAGDIFDAYVDMLKDRFGGNYDSVIDTYYNKSVSKASNMDNEAVSGVALNDITAKGFSDAQAQVIYDKVFKDKAPLAQRRLFKKSFPDVTEEEEDAKVQLLGSWYLQALKGVKKEEKLKELLNEAMVEKGSKTVPVAGKKLTEEERTTLGIAGAGEWVLTAANKWEKRSTFKAGDQQKLKIKANGQITRVWKTDSGKTKWVLQTRKAKTEKINTDIGRMFNKLDELTSGSSS